MSGKKNRKHVLHQHWVHSHEEDTDTEKVFRPATYNFPPSRGRKSFELKPDGSLVEHGIGPEDRARESKGTWKLEHDNILAFHLKSPSKPRQIMHILSADPDRLVIRKQPS
jgi:hypothetical protein